MKNQQIVISLTLLVLLAVIAGCANPMADNRNFVVQAKLNASLNGSRVASSSDPYEYQIIVTRFELLEGTDDIDPAVIYDAQGGYYLANLTSEDPTYLGAGIIDSGTYTHCRTTIVAISQEIDVYDNPLIQKRYMMAYQDFDNSSSLTTELPADIITKGDVLTYEESGFNWFQIDESKTYSYSQNKSDVTAYQASVNTGEEIKTVEFTSPVTIEEGKKYYGTLTFDVADTFVWDETDDDSQFEPTSDDHSGAMNGFQFRIEMPQITATAVTNQ